MNSEISTPLNNDLYTEYADVVSFLFRLSTLKLFRFSLLKMYVYNGKVSTTFAPAGMDGLCIHSHIIICDRICINQPSRAIYNFPTRAI